MSPTPTRITHLVAGRPWKGEAERSGPVFNPATGEQTGVVDFASTEVVGEAVARAKRAWSEEWGGSSLTRRTQVLFRFRELLNERKEDVAALITAEHGKVLSDALGEVGRGLEVAEFACGIPQLLKGQYSENVGGDIANWSQRMPLGVTVGITPFNFPFMVPMWMAPVAIACGNSFVLKPSERDPSAPRLLGELVHEAGFPPGVFNVVNGDKVAVDRLLAHPDVDAVSFVGSTPIARYVYETGTAHGKRVQALGGAKNHMVVLPDADVDLAADSAVSAAYGSAGERCMAISVVVAVGDVADPLVEGIEQRIADLVVAPGSDPDAEMGSLITREHRDRVAGHVAGAVEAGATVRVDGRDHVVAAGGDGDGGFFLGATLVDHVRTDMEVYRQEVFGPVLSVVRVDTFDDALALVNANPYGNGTAVFTRDGGAARRYTEEVEVGMVGVNVPIPVPASMYSFGGWKDSLFGDSHVYGPEGIHFYTRTKVVSSRWPSPESSTVDLGFPRND